jgi:hypothetical protein
VLARNADDPGWVATLAHVEAPVAPAAR